MATITREEIINVLREREFATEAVEIERNNIICHGIQFGRDRIAPIIYTDSIITEAEKNGTPLESIVNDIIAIYEANSAPAIDLEEIMTRSYIMDHVRIGLQRKTGEDIIKRACPLDEAIEEYLYITLDMGESAGMIKIKAGMLEAAKIDLWVIWIRAEENTFTDITVEDMSAVLRAFGVDTPEDASGMYVISNHERSRGAAAILNKKALAGIAKRHGTKKLVVIPSSIHECIVIPHTEHYNLDDICNMVVEINKAEVDPTEQLADRAYIIEF